MLLLLATTYLLFAASSLSFAQGLNPLIKSKPHVVVIGGGWSGWGAAKALCENNCDVTLIDAQSDPTGETPYLTPTGKPFEPGTKGFWFDYPNIESLVTDYLKLDPKKIWSPLTESCFYSPFGLEATAPVFSSFPLLPSPLGQVFASAKLFTRLPIPDRMSVAGLLLAMIDFKRDEETFMRYDKMTAHELFQKCGVSKRLVEDFLKPTLLVGLFKPPEELSAAVTLELLYFYALAHQTSFDVKWIKSKTINELIIAPLSKRLKEKHGLKVMSGTRVEGVHLDVMSSRITSVSYTTYPKSDRDRVNDKHKNNHKDSHSHIPSSKGAIHNVDAVVLALGAKGLASVMKGSPELAKASPELTKASSLGAIDCIATRIWFDKKIPTKAPANVFSRFPQQRGAGGTFFMLDQFQNEDQLWGGGGVEGDSHSNDTSLANVTRGSVVACDFYNAGALLSLSDSDIISLLKDELLSSTIPAFKEANIVDSHVERFPQAVNWFSPGSFTNRPPLKIPGIKNLVCAGDWVRMGSREHGSAGLCQERAYVTGLEAANELARSGVLVSSMKSGDSIADNDNNDNIVNNDSNDNGNEWRNDKLALVIPIREDEPQVILAMKINKKFKKMIGK